MTGIVVAPRVIIVPGVIVMSGIVAVPCIIVLPVVMLVDITGTPPTYVSPCTMVVIAIVLKPLG